MSFDDHLDALRAAGDCDRDDSALVQATRVRVRQSLDRGAGGGLRAHARLSGVVVAMAVLLVATASWAIATGQVQRILRGSDPAPVPAPVPAPAPTPFSGPKYAIVEPRRAPEVPSSAPTSPTVPPPRVPRTEPRATTHAPAPVRTAAAVDAPPIEPLYRKAHELHFHGTDAAAALAAWDAYLAAEPSGRFAVEARYNRAVCLIRLGRLDDARAALAPFARGEVEPTNYRRDEAAALVDRLDHLRPND